MATRPPTKDGLWQRPERLGYHESLRGLGGSVAPFLAGFSLATIALLVTADHAPRLAGPAIAALSAAAALLLYSMQVAFLALEHYASPADWLTWYPEATVNTRSLEAIRERQAEAQLQVKATWKAHAVTYELGIVFFLAGLFLLVWPKFPAHGDPSIWRLLALVPVGLALLTEAWWGFARVYNSVAQRRLPGPTPSLKDGPLTLSPLSATQEAGVMDPGRREAAGLGTGSNAEAGAASVSSAGSRAAESRSGK